MRDPVEDHLNEPSQAPRTSVGPASRPRSSRRSNSRPNDKDKPARLIQLVPEPIEESPPIENHRTTQRIPNGTVDDGGIDEKTHHVKHVKRKKDKSRNADNDEDAQAARPRNEEISLPSGRISVDVVEKSGRRPSSKGRSKSTRPGQPRDPAADIISEAEEQLVTPLAIDGKTVKHSTLVRPAGATKQPFVPEANGPTETITMKAYGVAPNEQPERIEVVLPVPKTRRRSKAKTAAFTSPNDTAATPANLPLPVLDEPPDMAISDKPRTTSRQRTRPSQVATPTVVLVELSELPTNSSAVLPPEDTATFEEMNETEQIGKKQKKHDKRKHRKKTKDGIDEESLRPEGSVERTEHEPLKPPRPPLVLSPSDATVFQRPEPPPDLGPTQKRPPTIHKKVPQTALLLAMTRKNKVSPYDAPTMDKPASEISAESLTLPIARPSGSSEELGEVEESQTRNKPGAGTAAEDSDLSVHKGHKNKKNKKIKHHKSPSEIKKNGSPEHSLRKSEMLMTSSIEAAENPAQRKEPEAEVAPQTAEENVEDEEGDHDSTQRKGKKKKKKRKDDDSGQVNMEEDIGTGKKKKRRKKPRENAQEDSHGAANEAGKNVEPTESEAARLADELYGKAVGNFFVLEDVLGKGGFGEARRGKHITTGKKYAIKLERTSDGNESLADEYKIYQILGQHIGFPKCYYFGVGPKNSNALVMDLLGPSLEDYFRAVDRQWTVKTICMVALQILERIEYVHSKGFVYSDIKPENFLVGLPEEHQDSTVFLIDFGLAQQFKDKDTGKYCYDENLKTHPVGTMRYMSVRSHEARSLSYRDDLESIGYLIIYFIRGRLPWQGSGIKDRAKKVKAVGLKKKNMTIEELCEECPPEIQEYMKYVRSIQFYAEPKYERLRNFFSHILTTNKWTDDGQFDWIGNAYDFSKTKKSESVLGKPADGIAAEDDTVKPEHRVLVGTPVVVVAPRLPKTVARQTTDSSTVEPDKASVTPKLKQGRRTAGAAQKSKVQVARASLPGATGPTIDPVPVIADKDVERPTAKPTSTSSYNPPSTHYDKPTRKKKHEGGCACC